MRNCVQCASNFLTNVRLDSPRAISFRSALRRTGRRARANWTLTIASLCRRRSSVPASSLLGARPSDLGMRYTSNDAPHGITSIAARHGTTGVYMRVRLRASYERAGRVAGQAGRPAARYFHSILLAPARSWPSARCSSSLARSSFGALLSIVGVAPSPSSPRPSPPPAI